MAIEKRAGYWLWVGGPVPPGSSGITLGPLVSVRTRAASNRHLLRHELIHVEQFGRYGFVGFLRRYVADYLRLRVAGYNHRNAYLRIPFEIEAEWKARTRAHSLDPALSLSEDPARD